MANAPISFTDIHNFATIKRVDDFEGYLYIIRRLDKVYVEHKEKDAKKHSSQDNTGNKQS